MSITFVDNHMLQQLLPSPAFLVPCCGVNGTLPIRALKSDFFAATNEFHWIQCECSHCVAAAVAAVLHKIGSEPILCGCGSIIMREVQIVVHQNHYFFQIFGQFKIRIQTYLMHVLAIK